MAYPSNHLYLTVSWEDTREPNEGGQFGIKFDAPATSVTQAMVDAAWTPVQTLWQSAGFAVPAPYRLRKLRLALIGTNGQYVPGTFSRDFIHPTGITVSANSANPMPMQVAQVATLLTELPRGQASHGRLYLPPLSTPLDATGRWSTAACDSRATAVALCLTQLNAAIQSPPGGLPSIASVFSKGTVKNANGLRSFVTGVKIGTRPDVQRRRAKGMAELYGAVKAVSH